MMHPWSPYPLHLSPIMATTLPSMLYGLWTMLSLFTLTVYPKVLTFGGNVENEDDRKLRR